MKNLLLFCLLFFSCSASTHEFKAIGGSHILVDTIELSGYEIWDHYFSSSTIFLVMRRPNRPFTLIKQPNYMGQNTPKSMMVCSEPQEDHDQEQPCNDPFYHVHTDQSMMGRAVANDICGAYGENVAVEYLLPSTFVDGSGLPYYLHHSAYKIHHGLTFNCWVDTAVTM